MQIYAQVIYAEHCRAEPMSDPKSIQSPWAIWTGSSNEETRLLDKKGYMVCSRERQGLMTIVMFALIELVHGEVGLSGIGCLALEHHNNNNNNNMYIYNIWPAPVSVSMLEARDLGHKVAAQIECGTCERVRFPCQVLEVLERRNWLHECIADWCWLSYLLYMYITITETATQPHSHTHTFSLVSVYCNMVWFNILSCLCSACLCFLLRVLVGACWYSPGLIHLSCPMDYWSILKVICSNNQGISRLLIFLRWVACKRLAHWHLALSPNCWTNVTQATSSSWPAMSQWSLLGPIAIRL